jgi:hypothetical protein
MIICLGNFMAGQLSEAGADADVVVDLLKYLWSE